MAINLRLARNSYISKLTYFISYPLPNRLSLSLDSLIESARILFDKKPDQILSRNLTVARLYYLVTPLVHTHTKSTHKILRS